MILPGETNAPLLEIGAQPPEQAQIDTLNVFDDSSFEDKTGTLTSTRLTGFNMAPDLLIPNGTAYGEPATFPGGITYGSAADGSTRIEVLNILMGVGNDNLTINPTLSTAAEHGGITTIHGGGNSLVGGVIDGDTISAIGGGGANSLLVIYGDTSQDASWYAGNPAQADRNDTLLLGAKPFDQVGTADDFFRFPRANPYGFVGNDVINAGALFTTANPNTTTIAVVMYGGAGDDTITGSQAGDHLAGGPGDDVIVAGGGLDHVYGDSGFNVNVIGDVTSLANRALALSERLRLAGPALTVATTNASTALNTDGLIAGNDRIDGNTGDDVLFGDHGIITQVVNTAVLLFPPTLKIRTTGEITDIRTAEPSNGGNDEIHGRTGLDRILGGNGNDLISGNEDPDVIFGDHGFIDYLPGDANLSTLDLIQSIDPSFGGVDTITSGRSADIVLGGGAGDFIDSGTEDDNVLDDNGAIDYAVGVAGFSTGDGNASTIDLIVTLDPSIGGVDTITSGQGNDAVLGGLAGDSIDSGTENDIVLGDHGVIDYALGVSGVSTGDGNPATLDRVQTLFPTIGGTDDIRAGAGDDTMSFN